MSHLQAETHFTADSKQPSLTIILPHPPRSLSPNGRASWWARAADTKRTRRDAELVTRQAMWDAGIDSHPWPAARLDIEWRHSGRRRDEDNAIASLKSALDGIVDAGMLTDDQYLHIGAVTFTKVRRDEQCVVLTLSSIGDA